MEVAQIIDDALYEYYVVERGEKVPNWRYIKDEDYGWNILKFRNGSKKSMTCLNNMKVYTRPVVHPTSVDASKSRNDRSSHD